MRHDLVGHSQSRYPTPRPAVTVAPNDDGAAVILTPNGNNIFAATPADLLNNLLLPRYQRTDITFHDADPYFKMLLPELQRLTQSGASVSITANGRGAIISATVKQGAHTWHIRDSHSLIPYNRPELAELLQQDEAATLEGQAAQIARATALYSSTVLSSFGVRAQITAGATSVAAWRATIPQGQLHYHHSRPVMEAAREACYGGLVYHRDTERHDNCYHIDRNGAYASIMREGVPVMGAIGPHDYEEEGLPGLYYCHVISPDHVPLPFVPYHDYQETYTKHLLGSSEMYAWMVTPMMEEARAQGYQVEVEQGWCFEKTAPVFNGFIDRCQALEIAHAGQPARKVIKLLRNSLHGKFGQHPSYRVYHLTKAPDLMWTPVISFMTGDEIEGLYYEVQEGERAHSFPLWYAWIVGRARAELIRLASRVGFDHVLYMDTDSLVLDEAGYYKAVWEGATPMGAHYGEWKLQAHYEWFQAAARKTYRAVTTDGEVVEHMAGSPPGLLNESQWAELAAGMKVSRTIPRTRHAGRVLEGRYS